MNAIFISVLLFFCSAHASLVTTEVEIEIIVKNIKAPKGFLVISFYNNAADFPKMGKDIHTERVEIKDTLPHSIRVKLPAEGWYAIAMYQNEDGKPKIKQDAIGIPEEPYAFSNNFHPKVEAPGLMHVSFMQEKKPKLCRYL